MSIAKKINDIKSLTNLIPLNELDHDKLSELIADGSVIHISKGKSVSSEVDKKNIAYLLSGKVQRAPNSSDAEIIKANTPRAKHPILSPDSRTRILAINDVTVMCIDSGMLDFLRSVGSVSGFEVEEIETDASKDWANILLQSTVVQGLAPANFQALISAVEPVSVAKDQVIFSQGDAADYYYILSKGHCSIAPDSKNSSPLTIRVGDAFGEEALIQGATRNTTVRMLSDGELLRLTQANYKNVLEKPLVTAITEVDAEKLEHDGAQIIDLRSARDFAIDGKGKNIPFELLRKRLNILDKSQTYLLKSDSNELSSVAAFMLGQHRLKAYAVTIDFKEKTLKKNQEQDADFRELKASVSGLKRQLADINSQLKIKKVKYIESQETIKSLERSLKETQKEAKQAIIESSTLKTKSESLLRTRINKINEELNLEKNASKRLYDLNKDLADQVKSLEERLKQGRSEAMKKVKSISSDVKNKEKQHIELNNMIASLRDDIDYRHARNILLLQEQAYLTDQITHHSHTDNQQSPEFIELSKQYHDLKTTLNETQDELSNIKTAEQSEALKKTVQELQTELDSLLSENNALTKQEKKSNQAFIAEQNTLKEQLDIASKNIDNLQDESASLQNKIKTIQQENDALKETIHNTNSELNEKTLAVDSLHADLKINKIALDELKNKNQASESNLNDANNFIQELEASIRDVRNRNADLHAQAMTLTEEKEETENRLNNEKLNTHRLEKDLQELQSEHQDLKNSSNERTIERDKARAELKTSQETTVQLEEDHLNLQSKHDEIIKHNNALQSEKEVLEQRLSDAQNKVLALEKNLTTLASKHKDLENSNNTLLKSKDELNNHLNNAKTDITNLNESLSLFQIDYDDLMEHKNSLVIEIDNSSRVIKKQEEQLLKLKINLEDTKKRETDTKNELALSREDIAGLEENLSQIRRSSKHSEEYIDQLEKICSDLKSDLKKQTDYKEKLTDKYKTLSENFKSLSIQSDDKTKKFIHAKSQYENKISQLTNIIRTERKNTKDAATEAKKSLATEHKNISNLEEIITSLQQDKKHRGIAIAILIIIALLAIMSTGATEYMGIIL